MSKELEFYKNRKIFAFYNGRLNFCPINGISHHCWLVERVGMSETRFNSLVRGYEDRYGVYFYMGDFETNDLVESVAMKCADYFDSSLPIYCGVIKGDIGDKWEPIKCLRGNATTASDERSIMSRHNTGQITDNVFKVLKAHGYFLDDTVKVRKHTANYDGELWEAQTISNGIDRVSVLSNDFYDSDVTKVIISVSCDNLFTGDKHIYNKLTTLFTAEYPDYTATIVEMLKPLLIADCNSTITF